MPVQIEWLRDQIIGIEWVVPMDGGQVQDCFAQLVGMLDECFPTTVHALFDIQHVGLIPVDAPLIAVRSRFLTKANLGKVAAVGMIPLAQSMAQIATRFTGKPIHFFKSEAEATKYLLESG